MTTPALRAGNRNLRVERAFAFLDLCGFTDYVTVHGDEAAVAVLRDLRAVVREIAPLCAVRIDKWLGDGVMLVGVDPDPLVAAVVTISDRVRSASALPLRAGIAAGPVISLEGDDYVGETVNIAARLCDEAGPGEILMLRSGGAVADGVVVADERTVNLRGVHDEIEVLELRSASDLLTRFGDFALLSIIEGIARPVLRR